MTAEELKRLLGLEPLPFEGGSFRETWRAGEIVPATALPARYGAPRALGTAILYLLEPGEVSRIHRLRSDEVFHFLLGDPVEMLALAPGAAAERVVLGSDLTAGQRVQHVVPRGVWQGSRLVAGGAWALLSTTVAPGFELADFEAADGAALAREWPAHADLIRALTR